MTQETIDISMSKSDLEEIKKTYPDYFFDYMVATGWVPTLTIATWKHKDTGSVILTWDALKEFEETNAVESTRYERDTDK